MPQEPTFDYERQYFGQGIKLIAGIDEAGMGALAGPVVAGAVIFNPPDLPKFSPLIRGDQEGFMRKGERRSEYIPYESSLIKKARENRNNPTEPEKKIWYEILRGKKLGGHKFLRQKPIHTYIVDFYCPALMLVIEVDGDSHDIDDAYDKQRTNQLNGLGIKVLRYTNSEIMNNVGGVFEHLQQFLQIHAQTHPFPPLSGRELIRDSKLLSAKQREKASAWIKENALTWAVGEASVEEITELNIRGAAQLAMRRAIENLQPQPNVLLIDGTPAQLYPTIPAENIIDGDALCFSIAAASILAKVHRDSIMQRLHTEFPMYGFTFHKGYGTKMHLDALRRYGASPIHRPTYAPVLQVL